MKKKIHTHGGDIYRHEHVVDFSANINFRGMPESVKRAAKEGVDYAAHYPDVACDKLREGIAKRDGVKKEHIICGNGAAELIFSLALALKPSEALLLVPSFYEYEQALLSVDCRIRRYYTKEEQDFQPQEDFLEQITEETEMVFLCNPNNPTGMVLEKDFLRKVLERCEACHALLVLDECFHDFLTDAGAYTMKAYVEHSQHIFILRAFTKMYAMAGLRLGYGFCSNETLMEQLHLVRQPWSVSIPAQMAGRAAVEEVEFVRESVEIITAERSFMRDTLRKKGYQVLDGKANYLFFKGSPFLYEECLEKGFLIRDCSNYEGLSKGWYRITIRTPEENRRLLEIL